MHVHGFFLWTGSRLIESAATTTILSAVEAEGRCVVGAGGSRRHSRVSCRWPGTLVPSTPSLLCCRSWPNCSLEEACVITCKSIQAEGPKPVALLPQAVCPRRHAHRAAPRRTAAEMARHAKTDSDVTSLAPSSPPRSPRRPAYYVHSPAASHPDVVASGGGGAAAEKMSLAGSTPAESPLHYHFHHSGAAMHHSRESSTGRLLFSDQLRSGGAAGAVPWRRLGHGRGAGSVGDDDDEEGDGGRPGSQSPWRCYALAAFAFVAVFAFFLLVLWGASKSYKPHVDVKSVVFESYHIQGGTDRTGVPTRMMSVNATVRLRFRNRGTFFGLHVTAAPVHLFFDDLTVASGNMKEFYQARKSGRVVTVSVVGKQVPLYGAGANLHSKPNNGRLGPAVVPVRLAFVLRARAHILGLLLRSKFYRRGVCRLDVREAHLGKPVHGVAAHCEYHDGR